MKTGREPVTQIETYRVALWMLLALLVWMASTGCAAAAEPQESGLGQTSLELYHEGPPTATLEVVQVDLNAIEIDLQSRKVAGSCKKVSSPLLQLIESENPIQAAQASGLRVHEEQVQVTLVLDDPDTAFLRQAEIEIDTQAGQEIQAFVPISKLCELATHKNVLAIRAPSQAETQ